MKKVFITGATGFLGRHLLLELRKTNYEVTALCRRIPESDQQISGIRYCAGDIEDFMSLSDVMPGAEVVIHAAALVSVRPDDDHRMYQVNVLGTRNVVNACLTFGVKKLIHISSVAALGGSNKNQILDERAGWNGVNAGYGYTKYLSELEVFRGHSEGLEVSIVNPSVILGPGEANRTSGMILQFIRKGWPIALDGSANVVDARDVSKAIVHLMNASISGERFILNGFSMPWSNLFARISKRLGGRSSYWIVPTRVAIGVLWLYEMFMKIAYQSPTVTAQAVRMATSGNSYSSDKVIKHLDFQFHSPESTLDWACSDAEKRV